MSAGTISSLLTRVQNFWQYLLFGWFLAVSLLIAFGGSLAGSLARIGVLLILAAVASVLLALAEQFRRQRKRNWVWLCYLLLTILAATAVTKFLVP